MTSQKKLCDFMWAKYNLMEENLPLDENGEPQELPPYFTLEDNQDILSWPDTLSKEVFQTLINNLKTYKISDTETCPFCIRLQVLVGRLQNESCRAFCGYGERHGVCGSAEENDYDLWSDWIDTHDWKGQLLETLEEGEK